MQYHAPLRPLSPWYLCLCCYAASRNSPGISFAHAVKHMVCMSSPHGKVLLQPVIDGEDKCGAGRRAEYSDAAATVEALETSLPP